MLLSLESGPIEIVVLFEEHRFSSTSNTFDYIGKKPSRHVDSVAVDDSEHHWSMMGSQGDYWLSL